MAHLALTGDFAMPNRADLMSLSTINHKKDQVNTNTSRFGTIRNTSNNLNTTDITGKYTQSNSSLTKMFRYRCCPKTARL